MHLPATYQMNNFVGISGGDLRPGPTIARKDVQVTFYGDPFSPDPQMAEQGNHVQAGRNFALFAIDCDFHAFGPAGAGLGRDRSA